MENQYFYKEGLFYLTGFDEMTEQSQNAIDMALSKNGAVGIAGGYYEDNLPLHFISTFLLVTLGYSSAKELSAATEGKFLNLIWKEDRHLFDINSFRNITAPRQYRVIRKDGTPVWVNEVKESSIDAAGKELWVISLQNINPEYTRELSLKKQSLDLKDTVAALSNLYFKVLKINLTTDSFESIKWDAEGNKEKGEMERVSCWTKRFVEEGNVLEEDKQVYMDFCNIKWLQEQLKNNNKNLTCRYRRWINGEFRWVKMDVVPSAEYTDDSQIAILYITDIEDDIRRQKEIVVAIRNAAYANTSLQRQIEITKAFGSFYFAIYSLDIKKRQYMEVVSPPMFQSRISSTGRTEELLNYICKHHVTREYQSEMQEFFNLDTLCERLGKGKIISHVYRGPINGWCRTSFIVERREENGRISYVTYASQSIHSERSAELETQNKLRFAVEEAEKANAAKSDFLSRMSHDIRTPINGILGMLEIIKKNREDELRVDDCIQKIGISANYLLSLVNDVLDMNKLESGNIELSEEPFQIRELLDSCYQIEHGHALNQGITLMMELPEKLPHEYLLGSPLHIRHIFLNIISNCIKYNRPHGKVLLKAEELYAEDGKAHYRFVVEDTGIGMSQEFLEHIFEAFTQENDSARTTFQGSGLGMAIVKKLIEKMNGEIRVDSKKNLGTRFTFQLPFSIDREALTEPAAISQEENADISHMKILLVEDNELNLEIAQFMLEDAGALITVAKNGKIALDKFQASAPNDFDLILTDVMMPVMDGLESTRAIRNLNRPDAKEIPIIAMTANAFAEDIKECKDAGMNDHIAKPLDMQLAKTVIARYKK